MLNRSVSRMAWLPLVVALGACGGGSQDQSSSDLLGVWRLVSLQASGGAVVEVKTPDTFTAHFGSDGRVALVADCNRCNAGYAASRDGIQVGLMACTRAYCSTAPLDTDFAGLVGAAGTWSVEGSQLTLTSAQGTLHLER